jgi:hypothetical protein
MRFCCCLGPKSLRKSRISRQNSFLFNFCWCDNPWGIHLGAKNCNPRSCNIGGNESYDPPASPENRRYDSRLVNVYWYNSLPRVPLLTSIFPSTRRTLIEESLHSRSAIPLPICLPGRSRPWLVNLSFVPLHSWTTRNHMVRDLGSKLDGELSSSFFGQNTPGSCASYDTWSYPWARPVVSCQLSDWRSNFP